MLDKVDRRPSILHIALQSGETYRSHREEADTTLMAALRPLIAADGEHKIPHVDARTLWVTRSGRLLLGTVWAQTPLCTIAVADQIVGADKLWLMIHEDTQSATRSDHSPPPPWCAVRTEPGLVGRPQDREWLGAFELALAWAWMEASPKAMRG